MSRNRRKTSPWARRAAARAEYFAVRLLLWFVGRAPWRWIGPLTAGLSALAIRWLPLRRGVLNQNLDIAFGAQAPDERRALIREIYRHSLTLIFECARLQRMSKPELLAAVECDPDLRRRLDAVIHSPRGGMIFTAHYGNWELGAAWFAAAFGRTIGVVYKPLHNLLIDDLLRRQRGMLGLRLFSTQGRIQRDLIDWLRRGGPVGVLPDQDARRLGEFLPFFGREASTSTGLAKLTQRMNLETGFCFCQRVAPGRFRLRAVFPEPADLASNRDQAARRFMDAYHRALEKTIRDDPAQYFWWHRRWKSRPGHKPRSRASAPAPLD